MTKLEVLPVNNNGDPKDSPDVWSVIITADRCNEKQIMNDKHRANLELMEGRTFILGREGHIYIDSPTASKHHH